MKRIESIIPPASHSPAPWTYDYNPYTAGQSSISDSGDEPREIPAFEIFDAEGDKIFDTNENGPADVQEANACVAALAPQMLAALLTFVAIDELANECAEWKWENLAEAFKAVRELIAEAGAVCPEYRIL